MRKLLSIILLAIIALSSYGREKAKEKNSTDFKRVQIGFIVSPDICFRTLRSFDGSPSGDLSLKMRKDTETFKMGYTTGMILNLNLKRNFGIETGIQFSNKGYQAKFEFSNIELQDPHIPDKSTSIYNFHYIDIPVKANFAIGKKRVRFITSVGITTSFLLNETVTNILIFPEQTEKETNPNDDEFNKVNFSPTISAGIDYEINSSMNVRIEPVFKYGVRKIIDTPLTAYLYSVGLNVAYYFGI